MEGSTSEETENYAMDFDAMVSELEELEQKLVSISIGGVAEHPSVVAHLVGHVAGLAAGKDQVFLPFGDHPGGGVTLDREHFVRAERHGYMLIVWIGPLELGINLARKIDVHRIAEPQDWTDLPSTDSDEPDEPFDYAAGVDSPAWAGT